MAKNSIKKKELFFYLSRISTKKVGFRFYLRRNPTFELEILIK